MFWQIERSGEAIKPDDMSEEGKNIREYDLIRRVRMTMLRSLILRSYFYDWMGIGSARYKTNNKNRAQLVETATQRVETIIPGFRLENHLSHSYKLTGW